MNAEHERAVLLRMRVPAAPVEVPWRTHGLLLRAVFFGLTAAGMLAFHLLFENGVVTGALSIALAEYLIRGRRWFWTGVEEALWIGAALALISELPSSGSHESLLVMAAAAAIPGARVRNPLFGVAAAVLVVAYFEKKADLGVIAALAIASLAVFALLRTWRRPSTEWLLIAIALVMPIAGRAYADTEWQTATIILYSAYAALTLFLAVRKRHHALFGSGAIALGIALTDLGERMATPLELKLAVAGATLLLGAWVVSRALRERRTGIVVTPAKLTDFDDEIELAATAALPREDFDQRMESGGEFGGAGATGKY